ncbi:MAG: A24 family peptidase C-terminal domain-containing protein [Methanocorpusculum sp.]|nr:A24 family peptidase C-terminal domain-containing protein [Methanocorpusculum sp.]
MISLPLAVSAVAVLITFLCASWQDWKTRTVYTVTWYPAAVVGVICAVIFWAEHIRAPLGLFTLVLSLTLAGLMAVFALLGLFGKADAKALALLSIAVPVTPFASWIFPSLTVSSLINAGLVILVVPAVCLVRNLLQKNRAPFWLMCSGRPVAGAEVTKHFGFIAEDISCEGGEISRKFVPVSDTFSSLRRHSPKMTRILAENPEKYAQELGLYAGCGKVWVTIGLPFIIPLTVGYVFALAGFSVADIMIALLW